ncbi:MAG: multicopper oxidase family protein [Deltaproteobacteria bacterium]|nr:multicopper oxidase family protein [Deltaproteobacteria bacterium]
MGGGGMGGGGGGSVIDPPVGALLRDPMAATDVSTVAGIVEVNLEARVAPIDVNGTLANLMTFNGEFPGPTIRVRRGDVLKVNYTNSLPYSSATNLLGYQRNITNLHTHGWHVSPEDPSDYVMYELMPGDTHNHRYDTSLQPGGSLNFYHPHIHGLAAEQYWAGLVGALVVEDTTPALEGYETHLLILKDISLNGSDPAPHAMMNDYMQGKEGSVVMVNGQVNPALSITNGQVQRWRILNASNARFYRLGLQSHSLYVIGTDGGLLDKPYLVSEVLLSPGERVDVLVQGTATGGSYKLLALPHARRGMMTSPTITLMTLTYDQGSVQESLPGSLDASAVRLNPKKLRIAAERTLTLSMGSGNGYINGQDFDVNPYTIMSMMDTYEIWTVVNQSGMDHPFHQHVNSAQVLSVTGGDAGYASLYTSTPAWKDTVLVPRMGSVKLLVPVMDFSGMAMFHCHILEHEDIGMMGMWHLM